MTGISVSRGRVLKWWWLATFILSLGLTPLRSSQAEVEEPDDDDVLSNSADSGGPLITLESFLEQVRSKHDDYRAAKRSYQAANLLSHESHLALFPSLFGSAQYTDDHRPNLLFNYEKTDTAQYQLGVSELTSFGLQGRAYYTLTNTDYDGLQFGGPPMNVSGSQGGATLELTFSLWRNFLGGETNLMIEQGDASNSADKYTQSYQLKSIMVAAEMTYWRLHLARKSVKVSQEALDRAQKLYDWHAKRAKLGLSNQADLLQADAALQSRRLDLRTALDQEVSAAREFNTARGDSSGAVNESLATLTLEQIEKLQIPAREAQRDDVRAAAEQVKATQAGAELSRQKYLPTFEAFGSVGTNTPNPENLSTAIGTSFSTARPTEMIGLRLNTPLDFGTVSDVREGWEAKKQAAEYSFQRKRFEQDSTWSDLTEKFAQAKTRRVLYEKLVQSQKLKLDWERDRRTKGLTTTQQVINFELEYQQALLGRIQTESDLLQLLAQMKLYGDTYGLR